VSYITNLVQIVINVIVVTIKCLDEIKQYELLHLYCDITCNQMHVFTLIW